MKQKGFTLAEVLITLLIIGIVAALTIPSVISNYQQQEFKTGLKKAVSVLNEAIQTNIAQEGETPYENYDLFKYLQRHMSVLKTNILSHCVNKADGKHIKLNDEQDICMEAGAGYLVNNTFYTTDGIRYEIPDRLFPHNKFILHESGVEAMWHYKKGKAYFDMYKQITSWDSANGFCGSYGLADNPNNTINTPCIIVVDVNGDKKPNPPISYKSSEAQYFANGTFDKIKIANQDFDYSYPSVSDKKLSDIFTIMITDEKAIPFGVVAQRAMYSK